MLGIRKGKKRRSKAPAFDGAPQRKGVVYRIATMSPRKPNSARRTFAKIRILIIIREFLQKYQVLEIIIYNRILLLWLEVMVLKILQVLIIILLEDYVILLVWRPMVVKIDVLSLV